tara:strand:- start:2384 stop:2611 length:228 start_codon:yes stop_codon:yes gene_type:complete
MDSITFDEIVSLLAKCGRPDLIQELHEVREFLIDETYDIKEEKFRKREPLSEDEGSAEEEDISYSVDKDGFFSLK